MLGVQRRRLYSALPPGLRMHFRFFPFFTHAWRIPLVQAQGMHLSVIRAALKNFSAESNGIATRAGTVPCGWFCWVCAWGQCTAM